VNKFRHIGFSIVFIGCCMTFLVARANVEAQQTGNLANTNTNFTKLFEFKFSRNVLGAEVNKQLQRDNAAYSKDLQVTVEYESPTTLLISGDLITETDLIFNTFLWQAMDLLKNQYGFKIQQVFTSGEGNKANPTRVYILMTK
jgi:hypothetical protein